MRLTLSLAVAALPIALAAAPFVAHAQGMGMDCFGNQGGRATCVESRDVVYDRLDQQAREAQAAASRQRKLVKKVAQAVHDGRCADALVLAVKSTDPVVPANTARLCGVPEAESGQAPPKS